MLGGSVDVWTKNILYWIIKSSTYFGMVRGAKMSLALNEPNRLFFIQFQTLPSGMHPKWKEITEFISKTAKEKSEDELPTEGPIELKDNSNCQQFLHY